MVLIENGSEPVFQGNEVRLWNLRHSDSVSKDSVVEVEMTMHKSVIAPGGIPTDPNYCGNLGGGIIGRRVQVVAAIGNQNATFDRYCVTKFVLNPEVDLWNKTLEVPIPDHVETGDATLTLYFVMADTGLNQFEQSYEGGPESAIVSTFEVTESTDGGNGTTDPPADGDDWKPVDPSEPLEAGDQVRIFHCVHAPDMPFDDVAATLSIQAAELTNQINQELDCMETEVVDTTLERSSGVVVEGDECEFLYISTVKIKSVNENCDPSQQKAGLVSSAILVSLSLVLVLAGISLVLWRTEKLFEGESGDNVSGPAGKIGTAALIAAGAFLISTADDTGN